MYMHDINEVMLIIVGLQFHIAVSSLAVEILSSKSLGKCTAHSLYHTNHDTMQSKHKPRKPDTLR